MLYVVSEEVRRATKRDYPTTFLLGHPSAPNLPGLVSRWRMPQMQALKKVYGLEELQLNQEDWGGIGSKPTTLATMRSWQKKIWVPRGLGRTRPSEEQRRLMTHQ